MIEIAGLGCVCLSEKTTTLGSSAGRVSAENDYYFFLTVFFHLVSITNMDMKSLLSRKIKQINAFLLFDVSLVSLYIRCFIYYLLMSKKLLFGTYCIHIVLQNTVAATGLRTQFLNDSYYYIVVKDT